MSGEAELERLLQTLKRAAAALESERVPFLLGGGLGCWARGGPPSSNDIDLMVKREDAEWALAALESAGMRPVRPPEQWLYKAWDILVTKLLALDEHNADYAHLLLVCRALREQVDWLALRQRTSSSPFAAAFFTLVEGLGIGPARSWSVTTRSSEA
ncbi:MAG TPA: hypothetical protein VNP96_04220 [Solirubrobacterales bacterium]|nr:hypothetical protein [Solirubrobacterales bacterium]